MNFFQKVGAANMAATILVVDDDENVLEFVVTALKRRDYVILEAGDGPSAVEIMIAGKPIDLLLTDIVLPGGLDGIQLGIEFARRYPDTPVIQMSAYPSYVSKLADEDPLSPAHKSKLLKKPYNLATLFSKVEATLKGATN